MKKILLLDREFGAGGSSIAAKLAQRLGWKLLDHELTREIARRANVSPETCERREERVDPWHQRLAHLIWRGSFEYNLPPEEFPVLNTNWLVSQVKLIIGEAIAAGPCVIVGRGAPYLLQDRAEVFCVFLYASRERRFRRVLERAGNPQRAIELVDTLNEERRKFTRHYFNREWPDRQIFHAMFNTAIGDDVTVEAILHLLNTVNQSPEAGKP
jgi:cytidylate kinase